MSRVKRGRQSVGEGGKLQNATRETAKEEPSERENGFWGSKV